MRHRGGGRTRKGLQRMLEKGQIRKRPREQQKRERKPKRNDRPRGQGYATEAGRAIRDEAFERLELPSRPRMSFWDRQGASSQTKSSSQNTGVGLIAPKPAQ